MSASSLHPTPSVASVYPFPRDARLRRAADFRAVFAEGRRLSSGQWSAVYRRSEAGPRLGLAISRKAAASAVQRNRLKRLARESFRHGCAALPPVDIVIMARPGAPAQSKQALRAELESLWRRITEQCGISSSS